MKNKNFITLRDNGVRYGQFPKKQLKFMQKGLKINEEEQRAFCVGDFPELTPENFRQYIFKLGNYIEIVTPSYPKFYKIKGINLISGNFKPISGKIIGESMLSILKKLGDQTPVLNDLKIEFDSGNRLYNVLVNLGVAAEESKEILYHSLSLDEDNVKITIRINSENVHIEINCKNRPIVYDMNGILKITEILGIISEHISNMSHNIVKIPRVGDWMCTSYRLGINGQYCYNIPEFYVTWKDMAGGFIRMYSDQAKEDRFHMVIDRRRMLL